MKLRRLPFAALLVGATGCGSEPAQGPAANREAGAPSASDAHAPSPDSASHDAATKIDGTKPAVRHADAAVEGDARTAPPGSSKDAGAADARTGGDSGRRGTGTFRKIVLTNEFLAEGSGYGDFDGNGTTDVVSGPYWYEGPSFTTKHVIYAPTPFDPKGYSDNFLEFVTDFDADGFPDVLVINYPGKDASVYENPKKPDVLWIRHQVFTAVDGESPAFTDLVGDARPELVFASGGKYGWAAPNWAAPFEPWGFVAASAAGGYSAFTHGLGVGDFDGDGRADLLDVGGIWIQPTSLTGAPTWRRVAQSFGSGGAQMFAYDVDGDGDRDVITSLVAHEYGVAWFEQRASGGMTTFTQHLIATTEPADAGSGPVIFQPHALAMADVDGNGLSDVVTGERFWGHVPAGTPDVTAPAKLYWFALERGPGGPRFTPHLVDDASGVGTQVVAADVNQDGLIDIVSGNKKGAFVFLQESDAP